MKSFEFDGTSDGEKFTYDVGEMKSAARAFKGNRVKFHIEKWKRRRSIQQNRARFGIAYKMIAERLTELWGEHVEPDDVHELIKQYKRFEWIFKEHNIGENFRDLPGGEKIELPNSTRRLTTIGDNILYEELQKWAAESLDINIPSPNENNQARNE